MSEFKHTPGPWTVGKVDPVRNGDEGGYRIDAPGIEQLCYVWNATHRWGEGCQPDTGKPFGSHDGEANAHLITAAPDLLEALQAMLARHDPESMYLTDENCAARAAIAKATGERA